MKLFVKPAYPLAMLCICTTLSACNTTAKHQPPQVDLPEHFTTGSIKKTAASLRFDPWWEEFRDPTLDRLIQRGMAENISIQQARQRLDIARIREILAVSGYYPQVQLGANASSSSSETNGIRTKGNSVAATGAASWAIDLFGGGRAARAEALANRAAAEADIEFVRLAYMTDLAITYIDYRYSDEAIAISRRNLSSFSKTLALTKEMREAGTANNLDVAQAQALVDDARAQIPPLEMEKQQAINHIATLLGTSTRDATGLVKGKSRLPKIPKMPATGVPADLLRNRPDIRREERLLASAAARIDVATARLYPSLTLTGNIDLTRLVTSTATGNITGWAFGPSVLVPILDGGKLRGEVDIAKAETRVQYLRWKDAILQAVEEVEDALVAINKGQAETAALSRKVSSYGTALGLARESYAGGTGLILDVLEADRSLGSARLDLADSLRRNAISIVRLHVAIGSGAGMDTRPSPQAIATTASTKATTAQTMPAKMDHSQGSL